VKEHLRSLLEKYPDPLKKRNIIREYVQAQILSILQNEGAMMPLAFHGGTALRFLFQLPRYSEDLDFTLEKPDHPYAFSRLMKAVQAGLDKQGYRTKIKLNDRKTVHSAFVRFEELLFEFNLTGQRDALFSVKIEVDTRPPSGTRLQTRIVRRYIPLHLQHHDPSSLFAGKIHAILQRTYVKGRDFYDLVWYLSDPEWPEPNFTMLNNALKQSGWKGDNLHSGNWRRVLLERVNNLDIDESGKDVTPFLENIREVRWLTRENFVGLIKNREG